MFHFLVTGLAVPSESPRLSTECCKRLARVFCAHGGHDDFINHLQALVRGLKTEDHLCTLARADSEPDVRRLVRLPVRELAPKAKKEQRVCHEDAARKQMQYDTKFREDVMDKFDTLDALAGLTRKDRLTFGEKPCVKGIESC